MTDEPRYVRVARALMDLFTPSGIDGLVLGFVVGAGGGMLFIYWWLGL